VCGEASRWRLTSSRRSSSFSASTLLALASRHQEAVGAEVISLRPDADVIIVLVTVVLVSAQTRCLIHIFRRVHDRYVASG
jgi:hypothetical protein